jgi:hypothetical protein
MEAGGGAKQGGEAQTAACAVCDHLTPQHAGAGALLCTDLLPIYGSATLIQNRQLFLRRCGCLAANAEHGGRNGEMWQVSQRLSWTCVVMRPNRPQLPIQKGTHKRNWLQFYAMVVCRVRTPYFCDPPKHASRLPLTPTVLEISTRATLWAGCGFLCGRKSCAAPSSSRHDHGDRHPFKAERREHEPFSSCAQHICRLVRFICRRRAAVALGRQARRERVAVSRLLL